MREYNFKKAEANWQKEWEKKKIYKAQDKGKKKKFYCLVEFPYPSGDGLHVGHTRSYTALDIVSRKRRMQGYNVLYPMGWDAFGLPTENRAIKLGIHPSIVTKRNTDTFRRQLKSLGFSFDWEREVNTTDPKYYKWTQWIFLQLYKKGLAYKNKMPINWCPSCKIGLANEEVVDNKCERCGAPSEKREKEQWMLAITKYADRLDKDLDTVDYLEKIKIQQRNWIGKSNGTEIDFAIKDSQEKLKVFTTRVDTIFGCTYVVVAPEHKLVHELEDQITNLAEVKEYVIEASKKSDLQRTELQKEKTGVELKGIKAINPFNNEEVPVFVADYVLGHYGTGAVMAVPAHDERDFEFARKYNLEIRESIAACDMTPKIDCYTSDGVAVNSGEFTGLTSAQAREKMGKWLEKNKKGKVTTQFKLRDWVFSRQHYWGEPIPMINCLKCGWVPVSEKSLPIELPNVKKYEPTDTGESPLAAITKWVNTKCPQCKGPAKRETDTMPNWAGSSWYFLRYMDPKNNKALADAKKLKYWGPIDWYNGGMEHTTLHLLYSRFWNKFLYDIKAVPFSEPYKKRTSHGMVLGPDGEKMSKSRGNVINPDDMVAAYGADAYRLYQMFMGPFDQAIPWDPKGIEGTSRFLSRGWRLQDKVSKGKVMESKSAITLLNKTIKKAGEDIEEMRFNTVVSALMILSNELEKEEKISVDTYSKFILMLAPFAPHFAEEVWANLKNPSYAKASAGKKKTIHLEPWPKFNPKKIIEDEVNLVVQINGKFRVAIKVPAAISQKEAEKMVLKNEVVAKWLENKPVKKTIFVPGRLINIII